MRRAFDWLAETATVCVALVAMLTCAGCSSGEGRPNLLLITLDTTRADRLGCYGAGDAATPNLDRIASEGVLGLP